jgi:hypothetical protein
MLQNSVPMYVAFTVHCTANHKYCIYMKGMLTLYIMKLRGNITP